MWICLGAQGSIQQQAGGDSSQSLCLTGGFAPTVSSVYTNTLRYTVLFASMPVLWILCSFYLLFLSGTDNNVGCTVTADITASIQSVYKTHFLLLLSELHLKCSEWMNECFCESCVGSRQCTESVTKREYCGCWICIKTCRQLSNKRGWNWLKNVLICTCSLLASIVCDTLQFFHSNNWFSHLYFIETYHTTPSWSSKMTILTSCINWSHCKYSCHMLNGSCNDYKLVARRKKACFVLRGIWRVLLSWIYMYRKTAIIRLLCLLCGKVPLGVSVRTGRRLKYSWLCFNEALLTKQHSTQPFRRTFEGGVSVWSIVKQINTVSTRRNKD